MELKYSFAFYICALVALIFIIFSFVNFRRKRKYKSGAKAYEPEYLKNIPYYKTVKALYRTLKFFLVLTTITSLLLAGFLMARPVKTEITEVQNRNRDIILCMDVSTSVDNLNARLIEKLEDVVNQLQGERFGIVIFNTTPVLICPLTTDYEYVLEILETCREALSLRDSYYSGGNVNYNRLYELDQFVSLGTLVDNDRGSSIIGDGMAGGVLSFSDYEENPDRTRIMIFTTDNDPYGTDIITMSEAATIASERNIIVYGVGTDSMTDSAMNSMKRAVEKTGGAFFYGESQRTVATIVENIQEHAATLDKIERHVSEKDLPEVPFIMLLVSVSAMMVLAKVCKV